jgi:NAD(P)-dependent dehydrogenase (short-subunit alcohol dehydrogenase family)
MTEIRGRTALVTGGGSGIGRALARALAAEGAFVVVADILEERAQLVAGGIRHAGGSALAVACDVSDRAAVRSVKAEANAAFGAVSLLFANAGVTSVERLNDLPDTDVDWLTGVNLLGVFHCLQAFLPDMIADRAGHVVATASMVGLIPSWLPHHATYVATKAGVIAMMLNLRAELSEVGIGCTVLCPGGVATRIHDTPRYRPARFGGPSEPAAKVPEMAQAFVQSQNISFRPPEEVADMVLLAVRENRPMVVTDSTRRQLFMQGYVDVVLSAFEDVAEFDRGR